MLHRCRSAHGSRRFTKWIMVGFTIVFGACTSGPEKLQSSEVSEARGRVASEISKDIVRIMTFNVENLFDTVNDPVKDDDTYLPLALKKKDRRVQASCARISRDKWRRECETLDWSQDVLQKKMQNLAQVVLSVNEGRGPDLLVLQEVENQSVVDQWNSKHLKSAAYSTRVLLEGWDERGIDVAILSRLPQAGQPRLHRIPFGPEHSNSEKDTRGILEVPLRLPNQQVLHVFAVHLPAPYHPHTMRVQALRFLEKLQNSIPKENLALAAGDFNVPVEEERDHKMFEKYAQPHWRVAHFVCDCGPGTIYYPPKKSWSFLDAILFGPVSRLKDPGNWQLPKESVQVIRHPLQTKPDGTPRSFDPVKQEGVSDHFPLYAELHRGA